MIDDRSIKNVISDNVLEEVELPDWKDILYIIIENIDSGLSIVDISGSLWLVNNRFSEIYKIKTENNLVGKTFREIFPFELATQQLDIVRECLSTQKEISVELRQKINGREYWYEVLSTPLSQSFFGSPCVIFITKDITKHKSIEQSLREGKKQLRAVVEDQTELIGRFLPDCTITFANQAWCRYFGKTIEEVTGSSLMSYIPEEDRHKVFQRLCSLTPEHAVIVNEQRYITKSGELRWQQWIDRAMFDNSGQVMEIQAVGRDITKLKKTETALKKSEKTLRRQKKVLEEKNIALREILEQIEYDKNQIKDDIISNMNDLIIPIVQKIKQQVTPQGLYYAELLESKLEIITSSLGRKISQAKLKLTPRELEICNLIKNGITNKGIGDLLNISIATVEKHRENIRKKFNISNKKINLSTFLQSI